jgi:hypothetical protein
MSTVHCRVTDGEIAARACVDQQIEKRCFCPKAVLAINEVQQIAMPKSRLEEQLDTCKAAAQAMLKKPADQRYAGPALRNLRGEPEPAEIPLPAPKNTSTEDDAMPPGPGKPAPSESLPAPARRVVPNVDEEEDGREAAIQAREDGERSTPPATRPIGKDPRVPRLPRKPSDNPGDAIRALKIFEKKCRRHGCGAGLDRRNGSGYCHDSPCQKALAEEKAQEKPRCSTAGCTRAAFGPSGKCSRCSKGVRPNGGFADCATRRCPKKVQLWRGEQKCTLCRRGLTSHLKEEPMGRPSSLDKITDAQFRKAYQDANGSVAALCRTLKTSHPTATKRCRELGLGEKAPKKTRELLPVGPTGPSTSSDYPVIVEDLNISAMSWDQLIAATRELRRRISERDLKVREAELALAGEPPMARTGT